MKRRRRVPVLMICVNNMISVVVKGTSTEYMNCVAASLLPSRVGLRNGKLMCVCILHTRRRRADERSLGVARQVSIGYFEIDIIDGVTRQTA